MDVDGVEALSEGDDAEDSTAAACTKQDQNGMRASEGNDSDSALDKSGECAESSSCVDSDSDDEEEESSESESESEDQLAENDSDASEDDLDDSSHPSTPRSESEWQYPEDNAPQVLQNQWQAQYAAVVSAADGVSQMDDRMGTGDHGGCSGASDHPPTRSPLLNTWGGADLDDEVMGGRWSPQGSPYLSYDVKEMVYPQAAMMGSAPPWQASRGASPAEFTDGFQAHEQHFGYDEPAHTSPVHDWEPVSPVRSAGGQVAIGPVPGPVSAELQPVLHQHQTAVDDEGEWRTEGSQHIGMRVLRATFNDSGQMMGSETGTIVGWLPAEEADFVSDHTQQPAALWHVRYDAEYMGEEDLEEFEVLEAVRDFQHFGNGDSGKRKRGEAAMPPEPKTPFLSWFHAHRARLQTDHPSMSFGQLIKRGAGIWKSKPEAFRQQYKTKHQLEMRLYRAALGEAHSPQGEAADSPRGGADGAVGDGKRRRFKQKEPITPKDMCRPKAPPTTFLMWFHANMKALQQQYLEAHPPSPREEPTPARNRARNRGRSSGESFGGSNLHELSKFAGKVSAPPSSAAARRARTRSLELGHAGADGGDSPGGGQMWADKPEAFKAEWAARRQERLAEYKRALEEYAAHDRVADDKAASPDAEHGRQLGATSDNGVGKDEQGEDGPTEFGWGIEGVDWWDEEDEEDKNDEDEDTVEAVSSALPDWFRHRVDEADSHRQAPMHQPSSRSDSACTQAPGDRLRVDVQGMDSCTHVDLTTSCDREGPAVDSEAAASLSTKGKKRKGLPVDEGEPDAPQSPKKALRACLLCGRAGHYQKKCPHKLAIEAGTYVYPWEEEDQEAEDDGLDGGADSVAVADVPSGQDGEAQQRRAVDAAQAGRQKKGESQFVMVVEEEWRDQRGFRLFEVGTEAPEHATRAREWWSSADIENSVLGQQKFLPMSGNWRIFSLNRRGWVPVKTRSGVSNPGKRGRPVLYKQIVREQHMVTMAYAALDRMALQQTTPGANGPTANTESQCDPQQSEVKGKSKSLPSSGAEVDADRRSQHSKRVAPFTEAAQAADSEGEDELRGQRGREGSGEARGRFGGERPRSKQEGSSRSICRQLQVSPGLAARRACLPCKLKKRKCSMERPCKACVQAGTEHECVDPECAWAVGGGRAGARADGAAVSQRTGDSEAGVDDSVQAGESDTGGQSEAQEEKRFGTEQAGTEQEAEGEQAADDSSGKTGATEGVLEDSMEVAGASDYGCQDGPTPSTDCDTTNGQSPERFKTDVCGEEFSPSALACDLSLAAEEENGSCERHDHHGGNVEPVVAAVLAEPSATDVRTADFVDRVAAVDAAVDAESSTLAVEDAIGREPSVASSEDKDVGTTEVEGATDSVGQLQSLSSRWKLNLHVQLFSERNQEELDEVDKQHEGAGLLDEPESGGRRKPDEMDATCDVEESGTIHGDESPVSEDAMNCRPSTAVSEVGQHGGLEVEDQPEVVEVRSSDSEMVASEAVPPSDRRSMLGRSLVASRVFGPCQLKKRKCIVERPCKTCVTEHECVGPECVPGVGDGRAGARAYDAAVSPCSGDGAATSWRRKAGGSSCVVGRCGPCKRRKKKCSMDRPCTSCIERGIQDECVGADSFPEVRARQAHTQLEWTPEPQLDEMHSPSDSGERGGDEQTVEGASMMLDMTWSFEVEEEWQREEARLLKERQQGEWARQLCELWWDLHHLIQAEQCGPTLLRLAWHDAASFRSDSGEWPMCGGVNGSIRMLPEVDYPGHQGLVVMMSLLHQLQHKHPMVSAPDLYQMAAAVAVVQSGGPELSLRWGRCEAGEPEECAPESACQSKLACEHARRPGETLGDQLRRVFRRMGFEEDREVVCLMGAHTMGRAHLPRCPHAAEKTPYTESAQGRVRGGSSWTKAWTVFDNSYFKALLEEEVDPFLLRLKSDLALIKDPGFRCWVEVYCQDQGLFFSDYAATHKKMSELGAKFEPEEGFVVDSIGIMVLD